MVQAGMRAAFICGCIRTPAISSTITSEPARMTSKLQEKNVCVRVASVTMTRRLLIAIAGATPRTAKTSRRHPPLPPPPPPKKKGGQIDTLPDTDLRVFVGKIHVRTTCREA